MDNRLYKNDDATSQAKANCSSAAAVVKWAVLFLCAGEEGHRQMDRNIHLQPFSSLQFRFLDCRLRPQPQCFFLDVIVKCECNVICHVIDG